MLRDGEQRVISVTPVSRGVLRPAILAFALVATIRYAADSLHGLVRYQGPLNVVLVGPVLVVVATRLWRWRSDKIHVTTQRIVVEYGVTRRIRTAVELRDVVFVRTQGGLGERLIGRGSVVIETVAGPWLVGTIRHPAALVRLIDAERLRRPESPWGYDDVVEPQFPWRSGDVQGIGWDRP